MSESASIRLVRDYIDKFDQGDVEGNFQYLADDFVYEAEPKPTVLGYTDSFNKAKYKEYRELTKKSAYNFKTTVESITESGDKLLVKAKTKFQYDVPVADGSADTRWGESQYSAAYTIVGDKIRAVKVITDPAVLAQFK